MAEPKKLVNWPRRIGMYIIMPICAGLLAWSIYQQSCGSEKPDKPHQVQPAKQ